ncbi:MAG: 4-(cytidine 5'-diphospho)-2-C-methyl-D-erythritol kinase [Clostridiales Family XIII bacterium]|jgi:4-diphosphocytidyl-2-C-methyl-D-erythritol kinase|nr:4-(cytidine 5'-diphospho)-2-C-methyl-D-erythritol kinase [Clostridiales Family XIII bacterium]
MGNISLRAFAKINLSLDVTGEPQNGYHPIRSVMQAIGVHDDIAVETKGRAGLYGGVSVKIDASTDMAAPGFSVPSGKGNIMYRAAVAMADHFCPLSGTGISLRVVKRIPVSAGLAGGSTDAAAVMLALARLWALDADLPALMRVGASVGADVPFCLIANAKLNPALGFADAGSASACALAEGIGEALTPLASARGGAILVKPNLAVSTARVYGLWDEYVADAAGLPPERPDTDALARALARTEASRGPREAASDAPANDISKYMVNVLEPVAARAYAAVGETIERIRGLIAPDRVFMSGSGPTVVAYFADRAEAEEAAARCARAFAAQPAEGYYVRFAELM